MELESPGVFLAPAFDEDAEFAPRRFHALEIASFGQLDDRLGLGAVVAFGQLGQQLVDDGYRFVDFVHADHVAVEAVSSGSCDFVEFHFVIYGVGLVLAQVAGPSAGTGCRSGHAIGDGLFAGQDADAFGTLLEYHVAGEHLMVFGQDRGQVFDEFSGFLDKVGMQVARNAANHVIVLDQTAGTAVFEDVQDFFPVAEGVEEGGERA